MKARVLEVRDVKTLGALPRRLPNTRIKEKTMKEESTKTVTKEPKDEVKIEDLQVHEVDGSKEEERLIKDLKEDVQKTVTEEHLADQAASADGEVDRDVPKELCGLSQSSTQASEAVDERTVRPLPPRPMHAPEPQPDSPLEPLEWEMLPDKHPSEAESERPFLNSCLKLLAQNLDADGGLQPYLVKRKQLTSALNKAKSEAEILNNAAMQMIRFALEDTIQERLRTGGQNLFVQEGWMMSMGNKKVVKLSWRCEGAEGKVSICWDWDVKLEDKEK